MHLEELERIFKRLEEAGIKLIILFSKDSKVIKSTLDPEETEKFVGTVIEIIDDSNNVLKRLFDTSTSINQIKILSNKSEEINVIIGKKYILAYKNENPKMELYSRFIEIADDIDNLYK